MHSTQAAADIKDDILGLKIFFNYLSEKSETSLDLIRIFSSESDGELEIISSDGLSNGFIARTINDFMVERGLEFDSHDSRGDHYFNYLSFFEGASKLLIVSFVNSTSNTNTKKLFIKFDKYPK